MGKKRSKTSKQRQARASKRFGVSVKKGRNREQQTIPLDAKRSSSSKSQIVASSSSSASQRSRLKSARPRDAEQDDFYRQMASCQERAAARNSTTKKKGALKSLAPATFVVEDKDKTIQRLLDETTSNVQNGLTGIGTKGASGLRKLPRWSEKVPAVLEADNPYAALGTGDSDDEEKETAPSLPLFRLAPPSFSLTTPGAAEVDPDL